MKLTTPAHYQERYIKRHYPEDHELICKLSGGQWTEKLYLYIHGLTEPPKCPVCGRPTKFNNMTDGYAEFCSIKCSALSPKIQEKIHTTCLKKYGVRKYTNREKFTQTMKDRYGVTNPNHLPEVREKISKTNSERYGGIGFSAPEVSDKFIQTMKDKYGVANFQQKDIKETYPELISFNGEEWACKCPHDDCQQCADRTYITNQRVHYMRRNRNIELCTIINPITHKSNKSTYPELFTRQILDEAGIEHIDNQYNIIPPKELDIYVPSKKIAIECNGVYYHSDKMMPASAHKHKRDICEQAGIHLLTIWEDQIYRIPEVVKSLVLSKFGIYKHVLYARKCEVREVEPDVCSKFLIANHLQGKTGTDVRLGLYYNKQLVAVMTFIKSRSCQGSKVKVDGQWELNRLCTALHTQVIGAAGKLLKYFIRHWQPMSIISFSHNDISWGNVYKTLGFEKTDKGNTSYYYIDHQMNRWHRSTFTKAGIVRRGWKDKVDSTWTEREVMDEHGYLRIYDCGTQKWVLQIKREP